MLFGDPGFKVQRMSRDPLDLWSMADLTTPFAIRAVATLRVADALRDGPLGLTELAERCSALPDPLGRVLRFLVHRGVFEEPENDVFAPNDAARALREDDPRGIREWLDLDGALGRADLAFTELLEQVRGNQSAYTATFESPFWEDLERDDDLSDSFDGIMETKTQGLAPTVANSYDWKRFDRVADIGGGRGVLIGQILRAHPSVYGIVVDLPTTVEHAREHLRDHGVADRTEAVSASFFDPLPVQADAYVLCDVLGDWDDEDAARILRRCAEAGGPNASVIVVERLPEAENMASFTEMDLRMMVYVGGRMRDRARTERVVASAGLFVAGVTRLDSDYCIIECLSDE